jgi:hypothetical protein
MDITLRLYQQQAAYELVAILERHRIAYLRGEVRTGKTLTALETARRLNVRSCLIVTKKKAIASIEADRDAIGLTGIVEVTNFEQVAKRSGRYYELLIVDEAHGIGAYPKPSKRWHDLRTIRFKHLLLMSGTPSPESFAQLYHQFALGPHPWADHRSFYEWARSGYVCIGTKYVGTGQQVNDYSNANEARILADINPLTVNITQQQAGFTTQIEEQVHLVRMKPRTYRLALRIIKDGVIGRPDCRSVLADTGAKTMSKLRQIYSGTVITEDHGAIIFDRSKANYIRDTFAGQKIAILYCFDAEGRMLRETFANRYTDSPETFNTDPSAVYIGQVQSSREGVNLSTADDLIFIGVDYSALSYLQGRDRASYYGRDRANRVHFIFAERSIESRVYRLVREKQTYTARHFAAERGILSSEADQALRGRGVVRPQADPNQQARHPRPTANAPQRGAAGGGQISIWPALENPGIPPQRATAAGL